MNLLIETLNGWADAALQFAWPMLWQSSLLIGLLLAVDLLLRRRLRAAVRYALWLLVLAKLVLPPSLAFPTGAGWWLRPVKTAMAERAPAKVVVTYGAEAVPTDPAPATPIVMPPMQAHLSAAACAGLCAAAISLGLLAWMLARWRQVVRDARRAASAPVWLRHLLPELSVPARLRLIDRSQSPAVCGLFRPVILVPRALAEQLPPEQMRAVLLHELFHLRRGDVWINCAQALLQIVYWWHPLLWVANARIRRVREEAVDDAVMLALNEEAETYAPTLLEVAKLALPRPLAALGLVGILESRSALRQRIERLVEFRPPRRAGLGLAAALGVLGFAALAVPMGEPPASSATSGSALPQLVTTNATTQAASTASSQVDQKAEVLGLVQDGKLLYEMGKLDDAKAKLTQALKADPQNQAANYYLQLVAQARQQGSGTASPTNPWPFSRTNTAHVSKGRQEILRKLGQIRLESISFDATPLSEVVRILADAARKQDPENVGINFVVVQAAERERAPREDVSSLPITIQPPLRNVRVADVLDVIAKVATRPIKYSIEDYCIMFSAKSAQDPKPLYLRAFKVDPNTLLHNLQVASRPADKDWQGKVVNALLESFAKAGAELDPAKHPGKAVFLNDRKGMLMVRGTLQDLDKIEQVVAQLNTAPPQINIRIKFIEVPQDDSKALGYDWYLGSVMINSNASGTQFSTPIASNLRPSAANPPGVFPGAAVSVGLRGSQPLPLNGILTDPQYRVVVRALEQRNGAEVLAHPEVTTVSGRQAQCKCADIKTIVTGMDERALKPPGLTGTNTFVFTTEQVELGPTLDVLPTLLADGYTINLRLTATLTEFLGYQEPTNRVDVYVNGKHRKISPPQPQFNVRQTSSVLNVWDGQTVVLGGMVSESVTTIKDQVPVLGDLPLVGKLFRSESKNTEKRNLLVFITATLIDPAGNLLHTGDEMPFALKGIPPQPNR
jgi:type II secretory pathway component GspD/PulD (secretin)/beta-lactamase regulating signal transducer with metallopeptidase domain